METSDDEADHAPKYVGCVYNFPDQSTHTGWVHNAGAGAGAAVDICLAEIGVV